MTQTNPTAFDCVSLLVGSYYVFCMAYPLPYRKQLTILETVMKGEVDQVRKKSRSNVCTDFLVELKRAKQTLLQMICKYNLQY